ncbi:MAG TPA: leucine-rich repeat protein [Clostridia bacterium]|nr:leucine-rich repeat protein [Clostridia bacterium]
METPDRDVRLPETVAGLPVTALGRHAFSPGKEQTAEGEQLQMTCGISDNKPDNRKLERITLPATLRRVGDYTFYNCAALREVHLSEKVSHWGIGVFMNCLMLDTFFIKTLDNRAESVYYFVNEFSQELDVTVTYPEGLPARLIFPGYTEAYQENISARHFDYTINGPGYPYHNMFRDRTLVIKDYDRLWPALLETEHDSACARRMAWYRLRYPRELKRDTEDQYLKFLRKNAAEVIFWLLQQKDNRGLAWFLPSSEAGHETLRLACEEARRLNAAEALALLLEVQHRHFSGGAEKSFAL